MAIQIRSPPRPPTEESWQRVQTFHLDQCSRSGQSRSGSRRRSSGARVATLFEIAANFFARWIDPHSYPISFCGLAHHIDDARAPQAGDRLWNVGPRLRLIGVTRYFALTTSSPMGRGRRLNIRGEAFGPRVEKAVFHKRRNQRVTGLRYKCALVNRNVKNHSLSCLFYFLHFCHANFLSRSMQNSEVHTLSFRLVGPYLLCETNPVGQSYI